MQSQTTEELKRIVNVQYYQQKISCFMFYLLTTFSPLLLLKCVDAELDKRSAANGLLCYFVMEVSDNCQGPRLHSSCVQAFSFLWAHE
jgi:hypothetical protein